MLAGEFSHTVFPGGEEDVGAAALAPETPRPARWPTVPVRRDCRAGMDGHQSVLPDETM